MCMEEGMAEIGAIFKDLKNVGVVLPIVFSFNSSVWLLQKPEGSWRMNIDLTTS